METAYLDGSDENYHSKVPMSMKTSKSDSEIGVPSAVLLHHPWQWYHQAVTDEA